MAKELLLWIQKKTVELDTSLVDPKDVKTLYRTQGKLELLEELYDLFNLGAVEIKEPQKTHH